MTSPTISVVVPTYNRLDTLRHVIPSLLAQDLRRGAYEVVVADSNSNDGTAEYLAEVARDNPIVRHLPGPYTGRASARNAGIAAALGRIVLFTDADIIASPDLLSRHLAHHEQPGARAVVGMEVQVSSYDDYLAKRADRTKREPLHGEKPKRLSWLYFLTGNASAPRAELDRVGRFDEDFTGYGHEDLELGYRLQHGGVPIVYEPRAVNYHWHPVPWDEQQQKYELVPISLPHRDQGRSSWIVRPFRASRAARSPRPTRARPSSSTAGSIAGAITAGSSSSTCATAGGSRR
jgi:glycosyltransferase involved in cell wall biosynthesis